MLGHQPFNLDGSFHGFNSVGHIYEPKASIFDCKIPQGKVEEVTDGSNVTGIFCRGNMMLVIYFLVRFLCFSIIIPGTNVVIQNLRISLLYM